MSIEKDQIGEQLDKLYQKALSFEDSGNAFDWFIDKVNKEIKTQNLFLEEAFQIEKKDNINPRKYNFKLVGGLIMEFKSIKEIKDAVDAGKTIYWVSGSYNIIKDVNGEYFIKHIYDLSCDMLLTWKINADEYRKKYGKEIDENYFHIDGDGIVLNGRLEQFSTRGE